MEQASMRPVTLGVCSENQLYFPTPDLSDTVDREMTGRIFGDVFTLKQGPSEEVMYQVPYPATTVAPPDTAERLAELASLMNVRGPDDPEVTQFIQTHARDKEFRELAQLSRALKKALTSKA
jgi:hypothetical protein